MTAANKVRVIPAPPDWQPPPRRPASWLGASELRRRARRRHALYWALTAACLLVFVLLINLLLERTRWSAGSSNKSAIGHIAP